MAQNTNEMILHINRINRFQMTQIDTIQWNSIHIHTLYIYVYIRLKKKEIETCKQIYQNVLQRTPGLLF